MVKEGDDMNAKMRFLISFLIIGVLCAILAFGGVWETEEDHKLHITEYVKVHHKELEAMVSELMAEGTRDVLEFDQWIVTYYQNTGMVQFETKSSGFGTQTTYKGFYYSEGDIPLGFGGARWQYSSDGDGWVWNEDNGDNSAYTEKILDHWYWFEMQF